MKKLAIVLLFSLILSGCNVKNLFIKKPSGLEIITTPPTSVYINGKHEGETPYSNHDIAPGEYTIRLVPSNFQGENQAWESTFTLDAQVTTIINKVFSESDTANTSYILQLKPEVNQSKSYISIISDPDTSNVSIDGNPQGFTPISKLEVTEGSHTLEIASPGYKPLVIAVNTSKGYNLIADVKLASDIIIIEQGIESTSSADLQSDEKNVENSPNEENLESSLETTEIEPPYVIIDETSTGWLRVRSNPNSYEDNELGKVETGDTLPYLDSNEFGWYQILFEGEEGWISSKYATLVKE